MDGWEGWWVGAEGVSMKYDGIMTGLVNRQAVKCIRYTRTVDRM
jgi:hypothetical protein